MCLTKRRYLSWYITAYKTVKSNTSQLQCDIDSFHFFHQMNFEFHGLFENKLFQISTKYWNAARRWPMQWHCSDSHLYNKKRFKIKVNFRIKGREYPSRIPTRNFRRRNFNNHLFYWFKMGIFPTWRFILTQIQRI